jgi:hypothetical protein
LGTGYATIMALFFALNSVIPSRLMTWLLPICCIIAAIALLFFEQKDTRRKLDQQHSIATTTPSVTLPHGISRSTNGIDY